MPVPVCRVCGCYMLPSDVGRPPSTCGESCRLEWKAARQKALRARRKALLHLARAIDALEGVNPIWHKHPKRFYQKLVTASPSDLAVVDRK